MMRRAFCLFAFFLMRYGLLYSQQSQTVSEYERSCISLFDDLKSAITLHLGQTKVTTWLVQENTSNNNSLERNVMGYSEIGRLRFYAKLISVKFLIEPQKG